MFPVQFKQRHGPTTKRGLASSYIVGATLAVALAPGFVGVQLTALAVTLAPFVEVLTSGPRFVGDPGGIDAREGRPYDIALLCAFLYRRGDPRGRHVSCQRRLYSPGKINRRCNQAHHSRP